MRLDEFEKKQLQQINHLDKQLNEGLGIGKTILSFLFGSKFKKILKKLVDHEEDYPEYQSALQNLKTQLDTFPELEKRGRDIIANLEADSERREERIKKLRAMR
jgi:hypothetical protein